MKTRDFLRPSTLQLLLFSFFLANFREIMSFRSIFSRCLFIRSLFDRGSRNIALIREVREFELRLGCWGPSAR